MVSDAGFKNLICFSGNRRNIGDEKGLLNCAEGLKKLLVMPKRCNNSNGIT